MDIFLKIDGMVGEAQHVEHKNVSVQMQGFSVSMKASLA